MHPLPQWPVLAAAALCVAAGCALLAIARRRGGLDRAGVGAAALVLAILVVAGFGVVLTPWSLLLSAPLALLALAWCTRAAADMRPAPRPRVLGGIAVALAWLGLAAAVLVDELPTIPAVESTFRSEPLTTTPLVVDAAKELKFGDVVALPGWWGDFELTMRVKYDGPAALEVRLRSPAPDQATGVVLFIGEDPVFRTGFARESATRIERIGSERDALAAQVAFPQRRLRIKARGDRLEATIEGVDGLAAQANDATFRAGRILLTPLHGNVTIDEIRVRPEPTTDVEPERGGVRWGFLALVLAIVAATVTATERKTAWAWSAVLAAAIGVAIVLARHESTFARVLAGQLVAFAAGALLVTSLGARGSSAARTAHALLVIVVVASPFLVVVRDPRVLFLPPACEATAFQGERSDPRTAWRLHAALRAEPEFVGLRRIGTQAWSAVRPKAAATLVLGDADALVEASPLFKFLKDAFVLPAAADPWTLRAMLLGPAAEVDARGVVVFVSEALTAAPMPSASSHLEPEAPQFRATVPWRLRAELERPAVVPVADALRPLADVLASLGVPAVLVVDAATDAAFDAVRSALAPTGVTVLRAASNDLANALKAALEAKPR